MNNTKLLSIVVPCYNSQDYLRRCLNTLIQGGPEVEIIVVDDGSTDKTAEIAREYCTRFPKMVRLKQKENGGHGSAINCGLEMAVGTYFKVVDSDDWLNVPAYKELLSKLRGVGPVDLVIANYVYEYVYTGKSYTVRYRNVFPRDRVISWEEMRRFRLEQLMLMHSMIYRTDLLRQCGLVLPEHTFYVDNLFAYLPLPYVRSLIYFDCDLYRYFIGRPDQSVNMNVMVKRIDQQLTVTYRMIEAFDVYSDIGSKELKLYMIHHLSMMVATSIVYINLAEENDKADRLNAYIRQKDERLYAAIRWNFLNVCANLSQVFGQRTTLQAMKIAKRIYKFS
ncbi:glycosyltransferase family 2 protein [Papillibacter cinnamivorans]|uniref:Glycosyltransferase involved in cell wall bisynthesis n=1 Tax=Papillibacter cinnamivorans DSM 12816 TaxID=1122930 RepID=A0A1W2AS84_9FIRM|nr:glycosyltransferase family 2 protein [Papillibacter cinnamivorans]SMC63577.1 Glycosyltransferase involved in cell wall bisynthesis [Papillibacter cinnamivorans DSM 12816]